MPRQKRSTTPKKHIKTKKRKKKNTGGSKKIILFFVFAILLCSLAFLYLNKEKFQKIKDLKFISHVAENIEYLKNSFTIEKWEATLYFGDENSDFLVKEMRKMATPRTPQKKAAALMSELIKGPLAKSVRTVPEKTRLRSVKISKAGLVEVDFSSELSEFHPGGSSSELMTVFSIVNTLVLNIKEAKKIKILIDGRKVETIAGHIDCREPFFPNLKLVR